ncbi:aldo/keto reductase [Salimicrobium halophilum]|uniref:Predicted oxidoreductase n=1 Tax=Salimicrobium halophilum TaxID=86666 RepID=A0A1G8S7I9_9BACI|nr:aldo/keto reductase [Salimicrobium halophilum]SDJ25146.1 Predicted oxidoreductase [Salimicrobium halophilum]
MNYRELGKTGMHISELSFGTWAIGGSWGNTNDEEAKAGLRKAMDAGVNFFDTADVYGMGHSEELLGETTKGKDIYLATKFCRQGDIEDPATYSEEQVRAYLEDSLRRLDREYVDLYQIHCPPLSILKQGDVFNVLEKLKAEGLIRAYGVSVESVEEGIYVMEHTKADVLQIIFNIFRQKPLEDLLPMAIDKQVGILARVPLASGLLTGKYEKNHTFDKEDHRHFNKEGEAFNVGETFAGLEFNKGVELSDEIYWIENGRGSRTRAALKWILQQPGITAVIPGFRNVNQVEDNLAALNVPDFGEDELSDLKDFYETEVAPNIRGKY